MDCLYSEKKLLLHDVIDGEMTEVKGVGKRRTQLLDDLKNRRRYWELKEGAEDRNDSLSTEHKENIHIFISPWICY